MSAVFYVAEHIIGDRLNRSTHHMQIFLITSQNGYQNDEHMHIYQYVGL